MDVWIEGLLVLNVLLLGWLHMRQNKMSSRLDNKVDKDSFDEVKENIENIRETLTEFRIESSGWQKLVEQMLSNRQEKS